MDVVAWVGDEDCHINIWTVEEGTLEGAPVVGPLDLVVQLVTVDQQLVDAWFEGSGVDVRFPPLHRSLILPSISEAHPPLILLVHVLAPQPDVHFLAGLYLESVQIDASRG